MYILHRRIKDQAQSRLFNLPLEVFSMIMDEWRKEQVSDRVMLSLVCKRFAEHLGVTRSTIPRPLTQGLNATTHKRNRLHFMLRLAPWFDNDATQENDAIQATESARAKRRFKEMDRVAIVDQGWILCIICLRYRKARVAMLDLSTDDKDTDPALLCGRWTRCIVHHDDKADLGVHRSPFEGIEANWTAMPADKTKLPDFCNPKSKIKKAKKGKAKGKGKGKAKDEPVEKTDAPQNSASVAKGTGNAKAPEDLTGIEECYYLPVDLDGERVAQFSVCPSHFFDPVKIMDL